MPQCADCGVITRGRRRTLISFDLCGEPPTVKAGLALAVGVALVPTSRVTADRGEPLLNAVVAGMGIVLPPLEVFRSALDDAPCGTAAKLQGSFTALAPDLRNRPSRRDKASQFHSLRSRGMSTKTRYPVVRYAPSKQMLLPFFRTHSGSRPSPLSPLP